MDAEEVDEEEDEVIDIAEEMQGKIEEEEIG
jgi:hypothetical protein